MEIPKKTLRLAVMSTCSGVPDINDELGVFARLASRKGRSKKIIERILTLSGQRPCRTLREDNHVSEWYESITVALFASDYRIWRKKYPTDILAY